MCCIHSSVVFAIVSGFEEFSRFCHDNNTSCHRLNLQKAWCDLGLGKTSSNIQYCKWVELSGWVCCINSKDKLDAYFTVHKTETCRRFLLGWGVAVHRVSMKISNPSWIHFVFDWTYTYPATEVWLHIFSFTMSTHWSSIYCSWSSLHWLLVLVDPIKSLVWVKKQGNYKHWNMEYNHTIPKISYF